MSNVAADPKPFLSPEVRVVEASAGSGKTYALAKRYVQLVLNPTLKLEQIPIRNILALTFTNKAAFEMKARILEFLKRIALKQLSKPQEDDILKPLGLNSDQASKKAYAVMEGVIRHYNFFQVQTIDKFINALLSGCSFKIGLTANFKIKTNFKDYLLYSLDQLIDRARHEKKVLKAFESFLHHYIYLENRSGWFPKDDILAIITTLFAQSNTYGGEFQVGSFTPDDVIKKKRLILDDIKLLHALLPQEAHAGFVKSITKFIDRSDKGFDIDRISDYFTRESVPVKKGVAVSDDMTKLWKKIRKNIKQLCHAEAYSLFNPYIQMFSQVMEGFTALAAKDDCLFLNELNKRAGALFDDDYVTVEEMYYRLATRFHHYLIDEFQDTSRLQWHNLEKMTEEALSTGGTLFYVGDRKQAIYGFRGGDVELFDDIKQMFKPFNVQVDVLANNWRSQKTIVDFNNAIFAADNLTRFIHTKESFQIEKDNKNLVHFSDDDIAAINRVFGGAQQAPQIKDHNGYVHLEYIDIDKKEERNVVVRKKLLALIKDLKKRCAYRDIAILTRGNQEIKEITHWFLQEGIPVESERTSDITENSTIVELIAFLNFLNSPIDNIAFTTFILGDFFAKATGLKTEDMHAFVFSLRGRLSAERDLYIYVEFRKKYEKIWKKFIEEFFSNVGLYPLYELIVTIYSRFNVLACKDAQGFLMHFLELVKNSEEDHADIQSFLEYFENLQGEDLYVHITDSDAVKILTIHKAKGLEFPVVIVPFLGMDIQIGSRSGEYQPSYILQQKNGQMNLLRLKKKYLKFSPELEAIYAREYKKNFLTELNNIYVALTRPQNELYGFIPKKIGSSFNFVKFLIPEEHYIIGKPQAYPSTRTKDDSICAIGPAQYSDWIDYLKDEFSNLDGLKNRQQRLKGELMHYALQHIGNLSNMDKEQAIGEALREVELRYPQVSDLSSHQGQLTELLDCEKLKRFFYCDGEVFTEKEVVNSYGHTKRCDRLIIMEDTVQIVDYKSSVDVQGRDREQIEEYKEILKSIYPDKVIEGYLIYFDSLEVEKI